MGCMRRTIGLATVAALSAGCVGAALAARTNAVSQSGRVFEPNRLAVALGDEVVIHNDDAGLLHHVYVESKDFSFESDEQNPGEKVTIRFPRAGSYEVRCGIHPKMRLLVDVR